MDDDVESDELNDPQNENSQLHEEENLDDYEEVEITQELPSVGEFPDIQYIIHHPQPIPASFHPFKQLFTDDILNIKLFYKFVKIIRKSLETLSNNTLVIDLGLATFILMQKRIFNEKCGQRHAWVEKPVGFLDNLSYI
ncbi:unnamed protein product [Rhizophagus irregularis]|nr:unnamed protein product [Rhizophagus irregularis]CAB4439252.1 unnamed protein product [Rhizophagus irregularis]